MTLEELIANRVKEIELNENFSLQLGRENRYYVSNKIDSSLDPFYFELGKQKRIEILSTAAAVKFNFAGNSERMIEFKKFIENTF